MVASKVQLYEYVTSTGTLRVDREKGVIHGVKILGLVSANGRRYSKEAIRGAAGLYEGRAVNVNHPLRPNDPRSAYDRFGRTVNVQVREDGLYGDLQYLKAHPLAGPLTEAAETMPTLFGMSHNAVGSEVQHGNERVVEAIEEVHSVDLVSDPATTKGLYESRDMPNVKIRAVLEGVYTRPAEQVILREMPEEPMAADMPAMPAESSADDQAAAAFEAMVVAVLRDSSLDMAAKKSKISEILKAQEKLTGQAPADSEGDSGGEGQGVAAEGKRPAPPPSDPALRQLQEELAALRREKRVRALCAEAGLQQLTEQQISALALVSDEASLKILIDGFNHGAAALRPAAPRSAGRVAVAEQKQPLTGLKTSTDWAKACLN